MKNFAKRECPAHEILANDFIKVAGILMHITEAKTNDFGECVWTMTDYHGNPLRSTMIVVPASASVKFYTEFTD